MITLFQPPPAWGLPSMSPFCVKLETYLRMAKFEYKGAAGNPMVAPKGKIPFVEIDGQRIGDSELIIEELIKRHGDRLDAHLTPKERVEVLAMRRLVEDHFYFAAAWLRWTTPESWSYVHDYFKPMLPPVIGGLILKKLRKNFVKALYLQGTGRHTRNEIINMAKVDIDAIATFLGDKPFFMGSEPTSLDATMYGFLIQQLWVPWDSEVKTHADTHPNLLAFCQRMKQRFWS